MCDIAGVKAFMPRLSTGSEVTRIVGTPLSSSYPYRKHG
jgi:hypothetical protein